MRKLLTCSFCAVLLVAPFALAQSPPAGPPKPAPELSQLKFFTGTWHCDGDNPASPFGPAHKSKATVKGDFELGGFWHTFRYEETKTAENANPVAGQGHWGYAPVAKKFVAVWVDSMGGLSHQTSAGWQGDNLVFAGETMMAGQKNASRDTFTKKEDGSLTHKGELQISGKWTVLDETTCKKGAKK